MKKRVVTSNAFLLAFGVFFGLVLSRSGSCHAPIGSQNDEREAPKYI